MLQAAKRNKINILLIVMSIISIITGTSPRIECQDDINNIQPQDVDDDSLYEEYDEKGKDIELVLVGASRTTEAIAVGLAATAATKAITGEPDAVIYGVGTVAAATSRIALEVMEDYVERRMKGVKEDLSEGRSPSPSRFDEDTPVSNSRTTESPSTVDNNIPVSSEGISDEMRREISEYNRNDIMGIFYHIMQYFNSLDDKTKLILCIIILLICAIFTYIILTLKNLTNKKLNEIYEDNNNQFIIKIIQIKNIMNRGMNIMLKLMILYCIIMAIIIIIFIIGYMD